MARHGVSRSVPRYPPRRRQALEQRQTERGESRGGSRGSGARGVRMRDFCEKEGVRAVAGRLTAEAVECAQRHRGRTERAERVGSATRPCGHSRGSKCAEARLHQMSQPTATQSNQARTRACLRAVRLRPESAQSADTDGRQPERTRRQQQAGGACCAVVPSGSSRCAERATPLCAAMHRCAVRGGRAAT